MIETQILSKYCHKNIIKFAIKNKVVDFICIITNDGWWKNTVGYKQHFAYARIRAIEQRKSILRSANTGISGLIHPDGKVVEQTNWNEEIAINVKVPFFWDWICYVI